MSALQIGILAACLALFIGFLLGAALQFFGKGGLRDLRIRLAEEEEINQSMRDELSHQVSLPGEKEGEGQEGQLGSHSSPQTIYGWVCAKRGHQWGSYSTGSRCIFCGFYLDDLSKIQEIQVLKDDYEALQREAEKLREVIFAANHRSADGRNGEAGIRNVDSPASPSSRLLDPSAHL